MAPIDQGGIRQPGEFGALDVANAIRNGDRGARCARVLHVAVTEGAVQAIGFEPELRRDTALIGLVVVAAKADVFLRAVAHEVAAGDAEAKEIR